MFPAPAYYVAFPGFAGGQLAIIDPATLNIRGFAKLPGVDGGSTGDLYAAPTKPVLYAIADFGMDVAVVSTNVLKVQRLITLPHPIDSLAISPSGDRLYGFNATGSRSPNDVFVIAGDMVTATITLPAQPGGVTVANGGRDIFASMPSSNKILVIDRDTNLIERTIFLGSCPFFGGSNPCEPIDLTTSTDGRYVIAACWRNAVVVDSVTDAIVQKIPLERGHGRVVAVDPFSNMVWLGFNGSWVGMSMAPPFSTTAMNHAGGAYSLAFQSAGLGAVLVQFDSSRFFVDRFTPTGYVRTTKVPVFPQTIVFSP